MPEQPPVLSRAKPRKRALLAVAVVLLLGLGFASFRVSRWLFSPSTDGVSDAKSTDPRLVYDGPYRNVHPDVGYVGNAACTPCHESIARSYARHPMGRSLVPAEELLDRQRYAPETHNPFTLLNRRFEVDREGKRLWHRQAVLDKSGKTAIDFTQEVRWAIGSGAKGYSYLTERDGYLFQTPISWFSHQQRWDLSPGFGPQVLTGRLVPASCLFCHANRVQAHPEHPDRFEPPFFTDRGIGCERCHGPGERHVQSADRWDIVNPAQLAPPLRDAVCEQCHLEGEARLVRAGRKLFDYRPGLPLHDFWAVVVRGSQSGEDAKAVNHVEQMYQSKCFSKAVGGVKLGCISCHDPHVAIGPAERQTHYRAKCLQCHDGTKEPPVCSEPLPRRKLKSPGDSCIDCHMPRYRSEDIAHTASTDHRIPRRPARQAVPFADLENAVLVDFYRDRFPQGDAQTERTLGLGLVKLINENRLAPRRHADRALRFLETALGHDPSDRSLREGKVEAYLLLHRPAEALGEAELILPEEPGNWPLLVQAAYAAQLSGQTERAVDYWRRAVEINPAVPNYRVGLMELLIRAGKMDEARKHSESILRLDPFNIAARQVRIGSLIQQGRKDEARREFDLIRLLNPPDMAEREKWFQQQIAH